MSDKILISMYRIYSEYPNYILVLRKRTEQAQFPLTLGSPAFRFLVLSSTRLSSLLRNDTRIVTRRGAQIQSAWSHGRLAVFCTVAFNICNIVIAGFCTAYKNVYQCTCTELKEPVNSEVHRSLQSCGSSVWNLFHITSMERFLTKSQ
jgi:hypothetical protein